jgi:hypothetical protein
MGVEVSISDGMLSDERLFKLSANSGRKKLPAAIPFATTTRTPYSEAVFTCQQESGMKTSIPLVLALTLLGACTPPADTGQKPTAGNPAATVRANITGSRAQPDPVEARIRALEQAGQLKVLAVRESWPLQFEIEGSAAVITDIQQLAKP